MKPLLALDGLRVSLAVANGRADVLRGISLSLDAGGTLGIVGESGSGKSMTALAIMGLLPEGARVTGKILFEDRDMTRLADADMQRLRGNRIAMIFQEPMTALNPLHTIGDQIGEALRLHRGLSRAAARAAAIDLIARVDLPEPDRRCDSFPHQLSGGQRQRAMIAMALACGPDLLIADEATTALDATVQRQIMTLLQTLRAETGMALMFVSHDLALVAENAQSIAVLYAGLVVEEGPVEKVMASPAHPYTRGLLAARPTLGRQAGRLPTIEGVAPAAGEIFDGCAFAPRCAYVLPACRAAPVPLFALEGNRSARCIRAGEMRAMA